MNGDETRESKEENGGRGAAYHRRPTEVIGEALNAPNILILSLWMKLMRKLNLRNISKVCLSPTTCTLKRTIAKRLSIHAPYTPYRPLKDGHVITT